jgi:4-alpha-glucanotransferase
MIALRRLARLWGVHTSYHDTAADVVVASREQLQTAIESLDPEFSDGDIEAATRRRIRDSSTSPLPAVVVIAAQRAGKAPLTLRSDTDLSEPPEIVREDGERQTLAGPGPVIASRTVDGQVFTVREIDIPPLPVGYHSLNTAAGSTWIFADPMQLPAPSGRLIGAFAPLYALHNSDAWQGGPTLKELEELAQWLGQFGGAFATLPLLAGFYDDSFESSPYRPVSRRHWNELYLDLATVPEMQISDQAKALAENPRFAERGLTVADADEVDYKHWYNHKAELLSLLADACWSSSQRRQELETFLEGHSDIADYARFRANNRHEPGSERNERSFQFHAYAQWQVRDQLGSMARDLKGAGPGLYLDMPVGVHPDGYDAWRDADSFAPKMSAGAPPDDFFSEGQNWALPVLHPGRCSKNGHAHLRASVRAHLEFAGILRVDHVMGLSRLYWVPHGMTAKEGVYVNYPRHEQFAVLAIEAHRAGANVIGENLGTVPASIKDILSARRIGGMYVGIFDIPNLAKGKPAITPDCVASLNTHDTPTFASFCAGGDIVVQRELGIIDEEELAPLIAERKAAIAHLLAKSGCHDIGELRDHLHGLLADSPAYLAMVTLEDLWLEALPQNVPGTGPERANWRRRLSRSNDHIRHSPEIANLPQSLKALRSAR